MDDGWQMLRGQGGTCWVEWFERKRKVGVGRLGWASTLLVL